MVSILIIARNEEKDLPGCITSIKWCNDIHVYDSFSTDNTTKIAVNLGAKVTQSKFEGYASQRNKALNTLTFKNEWVFLLDADERFPSHLKDTLSTVLKSVDKSVSAFRFRRRDYLGNTWLKHAQISPFFIRLIKIGSATYHREINEVLKINGKIEEVDDYFEHYPFSKGITHWITKHNLYSEMEAIRLIEERKDEINFSIMKAVFDKDFNVKRYHQKGLYYKLPGRPLIKWFYMMFFRMAFLDGFAGLTYATLQSIYEYFIVLKVRELKKKH
jgi:glycosyltransferase involved in cell wall biosynthesis